MSNERGIFFLPPEIQFIKNNLHPNIINPVIWWTIWLLGRELVSSKILNKVFVLVFLRLSAWLYFIPLYVFCGDY